MKNLKDLLAKLMILIILFIASVAIANAATISGTVKDGVTPIDGTVTPINVSVFTGDPCSNNQLVTNSMIDANGLFSINGLAPGTYYLQTTNNNQSNYINSWWNSGGGSFDCSAAEVIDVSTGDAPNTDYQLIQGYGISGAVNDGGGNPITEMGIGVQVFEGDPCGWHQWIGSSGADTGSYTIMGLPPGTYYLQTTNNNQSNYINSWWNSGGGSLDCSAAEVIDVSTGDAPNTDYQLIQGNSISGAVNDGGGNPITEMGINVQVFEGDPCGWHQWIGSSGADTGSYTIMGLLPGTYYLKTENFVSGYANEWYADSAGTISCQQADPVQIVDQNKIGIDFQLGPGGAVSGTVKDTTGNPISGFDGQIEVLLLVDDELQFLTGMNVDGSVGKYELYGLPTTEPILLKAISWDSQYASKWWTSGGGTYIFDAAENPPVPSTNADFTLEPGAVLRGNVVDENGNALENIQVLYGNEQARHWAGMPTDQWGFWLGGLPPGPTEFTIRPDISTGLAWFLDYYVLELGEEHTPGTIILKAGATITGKIYANGTPLSGLEYYYGARVEEGWGHSTSDGSFEFILPPGDHVLYLDIEEDYSMVPVQIHVNGSDVGTVVDLGILTAYDSGETYTGTVTMTGIVAGGAQLAAIAVSAGQQVTANDFGMTTTLGFSPVQPDDTYSLFVPPGESVDVIFGLLSEDSEGNESLTVIEYGEGLTGGNASLDFTFLNGSTVEGTITECGETVFPGTALLYREGDGKFAGFAEVNSSGHYVFYDVPDGSYYIVAVANNIDGSAQSDVFTLPDTPVVDLDLCEHPDPYLYDDFSGTRIDEAKWTKLDFVREVDSGLLLSKIRSVTGRARNLTTLIDPGLPVKALIADITIKSTSVDTGSNTEAFARADGFFYNAVASAPADPVGDVWAGVYVGDRGNGLEAWWSVDELLDGSYSTWNNSGSGTLVSPGTLGTDTAYTLEIVYDGDNHLEFTIYDTGTGSPIGNDSVDGPARHGPVYDKLITLTTGINSDSASGTGYVSAEFDNAAVTLDDGSDTVLGDAFDSLPLDPAVWSSREFVREINAGNEVNLVAHSTGSQETTRLDFAEIKPYTEATVTVSSDSWISAGAKGRARIGGYLYNDTYGPGSGLTYNGSEGTVWVSLHIDLKDDGTLHAYAGADRTMNPEETEFLNLFWNEFSIQILFDHPYTVSVRFTGNKLIFTCKDAVTEEQEVLEYNIMTLTYPPHQEYRSIRSRVYGNGSSGYMSVTFDDVYVADSVTEEKKRDELALDFGSLGLYRYDSGGWTHINSTNPGDMVAVDIDNDGKDELAIVFPGLGLYVWDETDGMSQVNYGTPEGMIALNNGLALDFGSLGLYRYDSGGWTHINYTNPGDMVAVDIDNDGKDELAIVFPGLGLYVWDETDGMSQVNYGTPEGMIALNNGLALDFGSLGLYRYDSGGWTHINYTNPGDMVAVDIDNDGKDELAIVFPGLGLYVWDKTDGMSQVNYGTPEGMIALNNGLALDFGSLGLYRYDSGGWTHINSTNPGDMVAVDIDNDGKDELAIVFPGLGLYVWDETNGMSRVNYETPEGMIAIDLRDQTSD